MVFDIKIPAGASVLLTNIQRRTKYNKNDEFEVDKEGRAVWRASLSLRGENDAFPQSLSVNVHTNEDLSGLSAGVVKSLPGLSAVLYNNNKGQVQTSYRCDGIEVEDVEELARRARAYDQLVARQRASASQGQTAQQVQQTQTETKRRRGLRQ